MALVSAEHPTEQPAILDLVENTRSRQVHALVGRRLTYCGRDVASAGWSRWGTNVVPLSDVTCGRCRRSLERIAETTHA